MSCDTFAKIVDNCKNDFSKTRSLESNNPHLFKIIDKMPYIISELENYQKISVYQSVAKILEVYLQKVTVGQEAVPTEDPYYNLVSQYVNSILQIVDILKAGDSANIGMVFLDPEIVISILLNINILSTVGSYANFPKNIVIFAR